MVANRARQLNCPTVWVKPAQELPGISSEDSRWATYQGVDYPLPLPGEVQLSNSAIAIAAIQVLQQRGWQVPTSAIQTGMAQACWPGRLQWSEWQNKPILIDGAHNTAAAKALRSYVERQGTGKQHESVNISVTWVMGMLVTKNHQAIFQALLRPNDQLLLVPVPEHSFAEPKTLAKLAREVCPGLTSCQTFSDLFVALDAATETSVHSESLVVLCGSLYLVGNFLRQTLRDGEMGKFKINN
ncbi:MAG: hypothetical protein F6K24_33605 [Okeania sp. SIO2D1]|nr:hypothetical protein [Okeania sp. SIO2D1]